MSEKYEEGLRRPLALTPYQASTAVLLVPQAALELALKACLASGNREMCCFWYGDRETTQSRVRALAIPRQRQTWGNYHVDADAMLAVSQALREAGWKNLSQLHSHPGVNVEHSVYDDNMANSRRALSIVFPAYGRWNGRWPEGIGIHEFQNGYWHLLDNKVAATRVRLVSEGGIRLIDLR